MFWQVLQGRRGLQGTRSIRQRLLGNLEDDGLKFRFLLVHFLPSHLHEVGTRCIHQVAASWNPR